MNIRNILFIKLCIFTVLFNSCGLKRSSSGITSSNPGPASCLANSTNPFSIVGGTDATINNSFAPAQNNTVALIIGDDLCSGTVVASNLILTAAHCFDNADVTSTSPGFVLFTNSIYVGNTVAISCWQRNSNYISCAQNSIYSCILNDIAWVKINGNVSTYGYSPVSILANPQNISTTETKWMAGFGKLNDNVENVSGDKYFVNTPIGGTHDQILSDRVALFNSGTSNNAFQNYLTVIGPYSGLGTCEGDSGGPVYVARTNLVNGATQYVLAALTQGDDNILTPKPYGAYPVFTYDYSTLANCNDGFGVFTTVGNYVSWITKTSGVTITTY